MQTIPRKNGAILPDVGAGAELDPTVLYVSGWCRSGSTVLGNVLAEVPGFFHAGELRYLWLNGVLGGGSNRRCGCGDELAGCPVWSKVLAAATPADRTMQEHAAEVVAWHAACRTRHTWRVLRRGPQGGWPAVLAATYRAVAEVTGAEVVVDTSKYASDAALLWRLDGIRPAHLHLVRDPRAVAFSYRRPKGYVERRSALDSTLHWVGANLAAESVARAHPGGSLRVRHEELAADPRAVVGRVLALAGRPGAPNPVAADGTVELGGNHTVTGNPDRFGRGRTRLRREEGWRAGLPARQRAVATVVALPLLARYGYLGRD
jgi:hypothetical protein